MVEEWSTVSNGKNLKTLIIIVIALIVIGSATALTLSANITGQKPVLKEYTKSYSGITAQEAKELVDNNINIIIVDIRTCDCDYKKGHIPTAIWQFHPPNLYDTAQDLLIYCQNGNKSIPYCEELIGHTYGAIYYIEDGIDSWEKEGYKTIPVEQQ